MSKDEILAASDRQLDEWAAERVMGWESDVNAFFESVWCDPTGQVQGYRGDTDGYAPTRHVAQAIRLLDHLAEQEFFSSINSNVNRLHRVSVGKRGEWGYCNGFCEDASRSRAIVVACLLALADVEELEASIAETEEQIDERLREAGYNPDEVGKYFGEVARNAIAKMDEATNGGGRV